MPTTTHRLDPSQICGTNFSYLRFPLERCLDDLVELGIGSVELWGVSPHLYPEDASAASLAKIRRALDERGLRLTCFTPEQVMYPINIAARETTIRERSVRYFLRSLDVCEALGAPLLFLTPGWGYVGEDADEVWQRSAASLRQISEAAHVRGVKTVLEALQPVESHVLHGVDDIARMVADVDCDALHVAIDTVAMAVAGERVADYTAAFGDRIAHVHLIDGAPDGHLAWGDGELPLEQYLRELADGGYAGALSFETIAQRYWLDPQTPVRQSRDAVAAAIASINAS